MYVSQHLKRKDVTSASMLQIDSKGMLLRYGINGVEQKDPVRIPFDPPLMGYEEVKPRLLSMKVDAEVELGAAKNPVIRNFVLPWRLILLGPGIPQLALILITFSSSTYANLARAYIPPWLIQLGWGILVTMHLLEAIYTAMLCITYKTGFYYGVSRFAQLSILG
ncbi:hypothetical protein FRC02_010803 [Tulasnella sp. 418]|nr:hypothetical protein FRC02_010803 [Tulasnella sp. 418]